MLQRLQSESKPDPHHRGQDNSGAHDDWRGRSKETLPHLSTVLELTESRLRPRDRPVGDDKTTPTKDAAVDRLHNLFKYPQEAVVHKGIWRVHFRSQSNRTCHVESRALEGTQTGPSLVRLRRTRHSPTLQVRHEYGGVRFRATLHICAQRGRAAALGQTTATVTGFTATLSNQ